MRASTGTQWVRRRLITVLMGVLAFLMAAATSAQADGTSGGSHYYDGKDPAATGCNVNASHIATRPIRNRDTGQQVASIQIFYSWSCATNWIRVDKNPYGGNATKFIQSSLGGWNSEWDPGHGSSYSMMVYAPGTTQISGYVYLFEPGINEYNWKAEGTFSL